MTSNVSICNRALQSIGTRTQIQSLSESSVEARNCALIFEDTRDEVLQMAYWNFAQKTDLLALVKSAPGTPTNPASTANQWSSAYPSPPWLYEYAYPTNCIQMARIVQQIQNTYVGTPYTTGGTNTYPYAVGPGAPFKVMTDADSQGQQQNVILTNQYQAIGIYTMRVTNPGLFGAQFVEALVQALAAKLVIALSGQVALANTKFAQANAIIAQARASDGNEGLTVIDNMPDWITIREDENDYWGVSVGYTAPLGPLYGMI
jgi:hypothetical protein